MQASDVRVMQAYEVKDFRQSGELIEPYCDACGQYEEDIAQGKLLFVRITEHHDLTLCRPCSQKLIAALSGKPAGTVIEDVDHGTYQLV